MDRILCGCAIRHLSLRFCIYGKPEGFKKGYTFSIVFSVTSFFSKQTTKKKTLTELPTPNLENGGIMKLYTFALLPTRWQRNTTIRC